MSSVTGTSSLESDGALQFTPMGGRVSILAGGGAGLLSGVGSPAYRIFVGLGWTNESSDRDGDGIPDDVDQCPTEAEDFDGFQDEDGCPDPDNDGDGLPDMTDKCPNEPETRNGYLDDDGCPDEPPDRDLDGIPDADDKCPDEGGSSVIRRRGPNYGCPDRDKDGIPDKLDKCPDEPEDYDGFEDEDGCPDPDNDQDGIPDDADECPDQAETYNGIKDDDGCPDGPALVEAAGDHLKFDAPVLFAANADVLGQKSSLVLEATSNLLRHHTEMLKLEIMVHAEGVGAKAEAFAKHRANVIAAFLAKKGVEAGRLSAVAGPASATSVEIKILQRGKPAAAPAAPAPADDGFEIAPAAPEPPAAEPPPPAAPAAAEPAKKAAPKKGAAKKAPAKPAPAPKPGGGGTDLGDL
jgi:outer membrane protein OmpA-like peptidoglycan-associated protein